MTSSQATNETKLAELLSRATTLFGTTSIGSSSIDEFCSLVKSEPEGPQITLRLLAHKLQSPVESEAMAALDVLQRCVETCGPTFHAEIGKFRFLNEIVKVISPKYFGVYTSTRVKDRCVEMMYSWTKTLKNEPKIGEAFEMLRKQGLLRVDPAAVELEAEAAKKAAEAEKQRVSAASAGSSLGLPEAPKKSEPRNPILDDERSKTLRLLLSSKRPEDLQAANQLIKESLKRDEERVERHTKRHTELEIVRNNMTLLTDMLDHYEESLLQPLSDTSSGKSPKNSSSESTGDADIDVMAELYMMLDKHRPALFRMASEVEETEDDMLAALLRANDELLEVLARYRHLVNGEPMVAPVAARPKPPQQKQQQQAQSYFVDVADLLTSSAAAATAPFTTTTTVAPQQQPQSTMSVGDLFSQELAAVGLSSSAAIPASGASGSESEAKSAFKEFSTGNDQELISLEGLAMAGGTATVSTASADAKAVQKLLDTLSSTSQQPSLMPAEVGPQRRGVSAKQLDALDLLGQEAIQKHLPGVSEKQKDKPSQAQNFVSEPVKQAIPSSTCLLDGDDIILPAATNSVSIDNKTSSDVKAETSSTPSFNSNENGTAVVGQLSAPGTTGSNNKTDSSSNSNSSNVSTNNVPLLSDLTFSLDRFRPHSSSTPLTLYQRNGLNVLLLLGNESPHSSVKVILISSTSMSPDAVSNFRLSFSVHAKQANICQIRSLEPSATALAAFNPIMPPAVVTQLIFVGFNSGVSYPELLKLRFEVSYRLRDTCYSESGIEEVPLFFEES